jgi:hypothetical protein
MRSDARKRLHPEPLTHHDPAVRALIHEAQANAWDQGEAAGLNNAQVSDEFAHNPYRATP